MACQFPVQSHFFLSRHFPYRVPVIFTSLKLPRRLLRRQPVPTRLSHVPWTRKGTLAPPPPPPPSTHSSPYPTSSPFLPTPLQQSTSNNWFFSPFYFIFSSLFFKFFSYPFTFAPFFRIVNEKKRMISFVWENKCSVCFARLISDLIFIEVSLRMRVHSHTPTKWHCSLKLHVNLLHFRLS